MDTENSTSESKVHTGKENKSHVTSGKGHDMPSGEKDNNDLSPRGGNEKTPGRRNSRKQKRAPAPPQRSSSLDRLADPSDMREYAIYSDTLVPPCDPKLRSGRNEIDNDVKPAAKQHSDNHDNGYKIQRQNSANYDSCVETSSVSSSIFSQSTTPGSPHSRNPPTSPSFSPSKSPTLSPSQSPRLEFNTDQYIPESHSIPQSPHTFSTFKSPPAAMKPGSDKDTTRFDQCYNDVMQDSYQEVRRQPDPADSSSSINPNTIELSIVENGDARTNDSNLFEGIENEKVPVSINSQCKHCLLGKCFSTTL